MQKECVGDGRGQDGKMYTRSGWTASIEVQRVKSGRKEEHKRMRGTKNMGSRDNDKRTEEGNTMYGVE